VLVLAGSGWLWFRDSSFVAVEEASVSGLTTPDAPRLRAALTAAARDMSTLHVRVEELEKAVSPFPVVKEVRAEADFPHGLRIEVVEHRPVALAAGGEGEPPVALADDGTLLRRLKPERNLPVLELEGGLPAGDRLTDPDALQLLRAIAAAPGPLVGRVRGAGHRKGQGLVISLRKGPELLFGDAGRAGAKWAAAARVLAHEDAADAAYVDVRLPDRPVAGGLAPIPDPDAEPLVPPDAEAVPGEVPVAPAPTVVAPEEVVPPPSTTSEGLTVP